MGDRDDSERTARGNAATTPHAAGAVDATISADGFTDPEAAAPDGEADLVAGTTVGEYVLDGVLGRGGFGTVYRATQPLIGKRVAIKVLSRKFSADAQMVSRFIAEARAVNQIRHRNIIDIFSFAQLPDGRQYYVMEHLEGEPLDHYLATNGPLTLDAALPILRAIARALDAAHAKGVAHRDLKAENVFLARDDDGGLFPKLLDFGIAKLTNSETQFAHKTSTGVPIGTPYYMSPEQCRGQGVDHRTDIYSFGVLAYRLLTGAYPFDGALIDILHMQIHKEPPPPSLANPALEGTIDDAVLWMMKKDPAQRPQSAIDAVVALQGGAPVSTAGSLAGAAAARSPAGAARRAPWVIAGLVVAAAAAGVTTWVVTREGGETAKPADPLAARAGSGSGAGSAPGSAAGSAAATRATGSDGRAAGSATVPAAPAQVIVTVTGVPEGTEVLVAGAVIGTAPGPVQLPRGDGRVVLTFRADGYLARSRTVVPTRDQDLKLALRRKHASRPRPRPHDDGEPDADDVIHVFGKEGQ